MCTRTCERECGDWVYGDVEAARPGPRVPVAAGADPALSDPRGSIGPMGNLYDYFSAGGDAAALAAFDGGPEAAGLPAVCAKEIDAYVEIGRLQALLTGDAYEDISRHERFCMLLSDPAAQGRWLVTLEDALRDALAGATPEQLAAVAVPWARDEDFEDDADPRALAEFLATLAGIARPARERGDRLYCLMSL